MTETVGKMKIVIEAIMPTMARLGLSART